MPLSNAVLSSALSGGFLPLAFTPKVLLLSLSSTGSPRFLQISIQPREQRSRNSLPELTGLQQRIVLRIREKRNFGKDAGHTRGGFARGSLAGVHDARGRKVHDARGRKRRRQRLALAGSRIT